MLLQYSEMSFTQNVCQTYSYDSDRLILGVKYVSSAGFKNEGFAMREHAALIAVKKTD
jgi:hypothetical protein